MRPEPDLLRRLLVTFAALAGLFAMHGMADHGVASAPLPAAAVTHHDPMTPGHHPMPPDHGGGSTGHDMAGLCLALLVMAAGMVAGLVGVRRALVAPREAPTRWRVLVARAARFRDPPDLHRLSVQRC
ncbi:DUF6153 family protein [Nocardioides daeguensis]|uniref:DUF2946 domain-containing protein n=1 Tax=Nocardioides daeguensis TaxID=908359 RepID=A0ABP6WFT9_9ACTN|nr:DUF6153 family protein [Nocardioides daeguensis]MBV6728033.1 hypothetical protein [Nocardioides daeguensis]MCR1774107.1 hypothetical protein [Nocardioides daeguensis]